GSRLEGSRGTGLCGRDGTREKGCGLPAPAMQDWRMCAPPYRVRRVRADEWRKVRDLRLRALQDPTAAIAFLESREAASERPEEFWRERAAGAAAGRTASQSVAETADGNWVGSATGLLEGPGSDDVEGRPVDHRQVHVVGVWVAAEYRGQGMVDDLIADGIGRA